jgi:antitoxin component YwqK of YwqJK toxin-antitoxin module
VNSLLKSSWKSTTRNICQWTLLCLLIEGCAVPYYEFREEGGSLSSISIIDRNGFSETIGNRERLQQYEQVDFLCNQPYSKVMRIYEKDAQGKAVAYITSYHTNGQPKQYLEIVNHRAFGEYKEWYSNGALKLTAQIIGGEADIDPSSQKSWLFEGTSYAWDESGKLLAQIPYFHGEMEGVSLYYHPNGRVWKQIPYSQNKEEGLFEIFRDDGELLQNFNYKQGLKEGPSIRYWREGCLAAEELYRQDTLQEGLYYSPEGTLIASIHCGSGLRALFGKNAICELQEYRHGIQEGEVQVFGDNGVLLRKYALKNGLKEGEEVEYYPLQSDKENVPIPHISITWREGSMQGIVKTWYASGVQENQREMSDNKKNGILTAWFEDGSVMLIEQYEHDKLIEGQYFMRGEKFPISEIHGGRGIATLFDARGNVLRKVQYLNSKPSTSKELS